MKSRSAGQLTNGLRRAVPVLPRVGLTETRTRTGHDDVDLFAMAQDWRRERHCNFIDVDSVG